MRVERPRPRPAPQVPARHAAVVRRRRNHLIRERHGPHGALVAHLQPSTFIQRRRRGAPDDDAPVLGARGRRRPAAGQAPDAARVLRLGDLGQRPVLRRSAVPEAHEAVVARREQLVGSNKTAAADPAAVRLERRERCGARAAAEDGDAAALAGRGDEAPGRGDRVDPLELVVREGRRVLARDVDGAGRGEVGRDGRRFRGRRRRRALAVSPSLVPPGASPGAGAPARRGDRRAGPAGARAARGRGARAAAPAPRPRGRRRGRGTA